MPKRRRFQPPITSFFTSESFPSDPTSSSRQAQQYQGSLSSPPLPDEVQSSLLTVGMRIRKSVPEGYKTHQPIYSSPSDHRSRCITGSLVKYPGSTLKSEPSSTTYGAYTELTPLCGLHKIGGMAVQPMPSAPVNAYGYGPWGGSAEQAEESDPWSLPSTQESIDSNLPAVPSNKRSYECEGDEGDDGYGFLSQQQLCFPFGHLSMPHQNPPPASPALCPPFQDSDASTSRAFAIPHSRLASSRDKNTAPEGQENLGTSSKSSWTMPSATTALEHEVDFEDADFLRAREDVDGGVGIGGW